ncbi:Putative ssh4-like, SPRY domain, B30.2/SPRY domain superfamily protein [Septoria linicola]|uniref:Ssh4-like, SPRY domain, B30.2/SPRY domain superfamily protein n=1 Tax=Septoria linicola TaxID=215465 RepID=A0A9Q9AXT3_9PEZI|nr:Putative ssh4-like, SPRY domain, B30.2/SPRY domain superfamily protein [Septoria linicola]
MSEKYQPPAGPPPSYRRTQASQDGNQQTQPQQQASQQADANSQSQRASWSIGGGASNQARGSNNSYRDAHLSVTPAPRPSTVNLPHTPSSRDQEQYQPPPGPPPGHKNRDQSQDVDMSDDQYEPPPGAPPSRSSHAPPSTSTTPNLPTPSSEPEQPPPEYDPWTGPDNNLQLPPSFAAANAQNTRSPTNNADYDDAARAHEWCRRNPLWPPQEHDSSIIERIEAGDLRLTCPPNTTDVTQYNPSLGHSYVRTSGAISDTIMLSDIPIYSANRQSPLSTGQPQTLYFELKVMAMGDRYGTGKNIESGIAIGFAAAPYPAWRLPGWHRGSLGVHGDDGRRYVDNSYGGIDFTSPFKKNDVVGIGMTFKPPVHGDRVGMRCDVFFTRNGTRDNGWSLQEERPVDADAGDIDGLEGEHDLLAAVGVFGSVEFEAVFRSEEWLYKF